jgi:uncharacterized protein YggE
MQSLFAQKPVQILVSLLLFMGIIALGSYARYINNETANSGVGPTAISVSGVGEVFATPDIGQFSFSVSAEGEDAASAQEASAKAINDIMAYLSDEDIEERDIKTTGYNLYPRYEYSERNCEFNGYCPPGERKLSGYEVSQTVSVKVRNLDSAGDLISGVGERGATNMSSLQFTIDDETVLKSQARDIAIKNATQEAERIADSLGVKVVRVIGFSENNSGGNMYYAKTANLEMAMDEAVGGVAPSIPTGENTITSNVNVEFEIK